MKLLVLKFPIEGNQKVVEFDEKSYAKENKCSLTGKQITVTSDYIIITYVIGSGFKVSVA